MKTISIIGCGSLGSFLALELSFMTQGFDWQLKLYDFDKVEDHNRLNQFFKKTDIGGHKTEMLKENLGLYGETPIEGVVEKISPQSELHGIVIVLVDSIQARKEILKAVSYRADIPLLIDARSGGKQASIFALDPRDPDNVKQYEKTLSGTPVPAPCADARTIPIIWQISALIGKLLSIFEEHKLKNFVEIVIDYEELPSIGLSAIMARVKGLFEK